MFLFKLQEGWKRRQTPPSLAAGISRLDKHLIHFVCKCHWRKSLSKALGIGLNSVYPEEWMKWFPKVLFTLTRVDQMKHKSVSWGLWLSSVQSLSRVRLFATPWIAARQASLSITNSRSSLRLTSIKSVMPSSHHTLCRPLLLLPPIPPSIRVFAKFSWGGQSTGASASASFLPKKSQGWSPSEWTGWISLQPKGLSRVFSNTTVQKHQFFSTQLSPQSNSHIHTWPQEKP